MKKITLPQVESLEDIQEILLHYEYSNLHSLEFLIKRYDYYYIINFTVSYSPYEGVYTYEAFTNSETFESESLNELITKLLEYFY